MNTALYGFSLMKTLVFVCIAVIGTPPAYTQEIVPGIDLIYGHSIYHEHQKEAGVAMALSITPEQKYEKLADPCEDLRAAAELAHVREGGLHLRTIFVVPYKGMAVEGHYLPNGGGFENTALVSGSSVSRTVLDHILTRVGIPPSILDEKSVEHEISCMLEEPLWTIVWYDVRRIGDEDPYAVIERARHRFLTIHRRVARHAGRQ